MHFSAYYIIFQSYRVEDDDENDDHLMPTPVESFLKVFIMSLGNFGDIWDALEFTNHTIAGEVNTYFFKNIDAWIKLKLTESCVFKVITYLISCIM